MCDHKVAVPTRGTAERPRKSHNSKMQNMFYIVTEHVVPLTKVNHPVPPLLCPSRKDSAVAKETGRTEDPARVFPLLCPTVSAPSCCALTCLTYAPSPPCGRGRERESTQHCCWMSNPEKRLDDEDVGRLCTVNHIKP